MKTKGLTEKGQAEVRTGRQKDALKSTDKQKGKKT